MIGIEDDNKGVLVILPEYVRQNQVLICNKDNKIYKNIKEVTLKLLESEVFTISNNWKEKMVSSWKRNRCTYLMKKTYNCK